MIKIHEEAIIELVDGDFKSNFSNNDLKQWIDNRRDSIFYQDRDFFDISVKRGELSYLRHSYSNYDEVLNQLTTENINSITSIRYVYVKDLLYYNNEYAYKYNIRIEDEEHFDGLDKISIRKAIYIDIKTAITDSIDSICVLRIINNYKIIENERLRWQEENRKARFEQERLVDEAKTLQGDITNLEETLHKKYRSFTSDYTDPNSLQTEAGNSLLAAIINLLWPTSWISLMFFSVIISAPTNDSLRNFAIFASAVILGLPYLIPIVKFFILISLYLHQKPVYISKLQEYRKSCYKLLKQYDTMIESFYQKYNKTPSYNNTYTLREIDRKINDLQK